MKNLFTQLSRLTPPQVVCFAGLALALAGFWLSPLSLANLFHTVAQPSRMTPITLDSERVPSNLQLPTKPVDRHIDCGKVACLALTFDDGPNPITTPQVLDVLEHEQVPATFFVVGSRVPGQEKLLRRMFYDGNEVGSHSWNHPDFTTLSSEQIIDQINRTQAVVMAAGLPEIGRAHV